MPRERVRQRRRVLAGVDVQLQAGHRARPRGPDPLRLPAPRGAHRTPARTAARTRPPPRAPARSCRYRDGRDDRHVEGLRPHRQVAQLAAVDQRAVPRDQHRALAFQLAHPCEAQERGRGLSFLAVVDYGQRAGVHRARERLRLSRHHHERSQSAWASSFRTSSTIAAARTARSGPPNLRRGAASRWRSSSREGSLRSSRPSRQPIRRATRRTRSPRSRAGRAPHRPASWCRSAAARCPSSWPGRWGCRDRPPCRPRPRSRPRCRHRRRGGRPSDRNASVGPFNERPPTSGLTATTGASVSARPPASRARPASARCSRSGSRARSPPPPPGRSPRPPPVSPAPRRRHGTPLPERRPEC